MTSLENRLSVLWVDFHLNGSQSALREMTDLIARLKDHDDFQIAQRFLSASNRSAK